MTQCSDNKTLDELRKSVIPPGYGSATTCYVESAKGALIKDIEGNEFIDFAGGIAVMNVGHSHPKVVAAIKEQAERFVHTCFMVAPYEPPVRLAQKLCEITPGDFDKQVIFINSGAEAVENAVKIARYYTKRPGIVVFENAFHGRTLLTMSMTSKIKPFKLGFGPFAPEIYRMPFGDMAGPEKLEDFFIKYVNPEAVAAVVAEPVQGEGGFVAPPPGYFQKMVEICKKHGILFVSDEIQSGMGRTGKMFAIEHWGVEPDIITLAKSFAGGMPLSAVVARKEIIECVHPGGLGGTYGANPVACAAALAVLEVFEEENLLKRAQEMGDTLNTRFQAWQERFDTVGEVRGLGAMLGLTIVNAEGAPAPGLATKLAAFCLDKGLLILVTGIYGNVVRVLAPFVITDAQLAQGLDIMEAGLAELTA